MSTVIHSMMPTPIAGEVIDSAESVETNIGDCTTLALAPKARITRTGLVFSDGITFAEWEALEEPLGVMMVGLQWAIGDWFNYGEQWFGEQFAQALDASRLDPQTVQQYAWVCRQVPHDRRVPTLSFSHHREVADLAPNEQGAWLVKADAEGYSSHRLRRELAKATKAESRLWVLVAATSPEDAESLCARLTAEGRAAKVIER